MKCPHNDGVHKFKLIKKGGAVVGKQCDLCGKKLRKKSRTQSTEQGWTFNDSSNGVVGGLTELARACGEAAVVIDYTLFVSYCLNSGVDKATVLKNKNFAEDFLKSGIAVNVLDAQTSDGLKLVMVLTKVEEAFDVSPLLRGKAAEDG